MSLVLFCLLFSSVDYVPVKGEIMKVEFKVEYNIHIEIALILIG